jgi:hypothetical protein
VRPVGLRLLAAAAAVAVVAGIGSAVVLATGSPRTAGHAARAAAPSGCAARLLRDWSDGRIDGVYPIACYRAALRSLPTDLAVYSSASEDIKQALTQRIVQGTHGGRRSLTR